MQELDIINQLDFGTEYIVETLVHVDNNDNSNLSAYYPEYGLGKVVKASNEQIYKVGDIILYNRKGTHSPFMLLGKRYIGLGRDYISVRLSSEVLEQLKCS